MGFREGQVDSRKIQGVRTPWVMGHLRAGQDEVVREIESAGFRLVADIDFFKTN